MNNLVSSLRPQTLNYRPLLRVKTTTLHSVGCKVAHVVSFYRQINSVELISKEVP